MTADRKKIAQYLDEAHAMELALVRTLQAHSAMTPPGPYRDALAEHLRETREHADRVARRLRELGGGRRGPAALGYGIAQRLVGQVLSLAKAPLDMTRGTSAEEKLLKNAKDECATEALEIATYDALEQLARTAGDDTTAQLAAELRADEERMLATLREQIPRLTAAVAGDVLSGAEPAGDVATGAAQEREQRHAPLPQYDELTVDDVVARLEDLTPARLRHVAAYERAHKRRRGVIEAVERRREAVDGSRERASAPS